MVRGPFVTFEGVEGCGKSTQLALLSRDLRSSGREVVTTREPGGTALGERLRDLLLDPAFAPVPVAEVCIFEAARAQLVAQVIRPALERGAVVLADRFADSSTVNQGVARGLGVAAVAALNTFACGGLVPDRTIVIDLAVETALARARSRSGTTAANRRFEDETLDFHRAVASGFHELAVREAARVRFVAGDGTIEAVAERVRAALVGVLP